MSKYAQELKVALEAVKSASSVCHRIRQSQLSEDAISKKDKSPVTIADFASQAVIIQHLETAFPNDPIVAEEDLEQLEAIRGSALGDSMVGFIQDLLPDADWQAISSWVALGNYSGGAKGRFWTIDPIDGTKGFLRNGQYAVALALIEDGIPVLGVLGCPNYPVNGFSDSENKDDGLLFYAVDGEGAYKMTLDGGEAETIHVQEVANAGEARFCESVESGHSSHGRSQKIADALGVTSEPLRIDSQCKYAAVSSGEASIYLRLPTSETYREKIWDHAAGWIIHREAGGLATDVYGKPLDFSLGEQLEKNLGIVAAPASIHGAIIQVMPDILA